MLLSFAVLGLLCVFALATLLRAEPARRYRRYILPGFLFLWALLGWQAHTRALLSESAGELVSRPIEVPKNGFVSSDECKACHAREYHTWHATYHRTMTQVASPETVTGDFTVEPFVFDEMRFRPFQREGKFFLGVTDLRDNPYASDETLHEITLLTGSHNYQVYWFAAGDGRELDMLPVVYFLRESRWIPRQAIFVTPASDFREHDEKGRWNNECVLCHAVNGRDENWRTEAAGNDSQVSEFGIACEACHGPAAEHVDFYRNPWNRYLAHFGFVAPAAIVQPAKLSAQRANHVCGQCHSIQQMRSDWRETGLKFRPGDLLDEHRKLLWGDSTENWADSGAMPEGYYWEDGVVRVRGREFHDVLRSPCYQGGDFSCLTCHSLHKERDDVRSDREWADRLLRPAAVTGQVCLECHGEYQDASVLRQHTHHEPDSSGSQCMNCHMPNTNIGFLRGMRNHRITVPDVLLSVETGRPLACNQCHLDQTLEWTNTRMQEWYGRDAIDLDDEYRSLAASLVWLWRGDPGVRTLMAWNLRWEPALAVSGSAWTTPHLLQLLDDPYPGVRQAALRTLETHGVLPVGALDVHGNDVERRRKIAGIREEWRMRRDPSIIGAATGRLLVSAQNQLDHDGVASLKRQRTVIEMTLSE